MPVLEELAYGVARGVVRAWFDVQAERAKAVVEVADPTDRDRADRFRNAVQLQQAAGIGNPPPDHPASAQPAGNPVDMGRSGPDTQGRAASTGAGGLVAGQPNRGGG